MHGCHKTSPYEGDTCTFTIWYAYTLAAAKLINSVYSNNNFFCININEKSKPIIVILRTIGLVPHWKLGLMGWYM